MPIAGWHACRLRDPGEFQEDSFRTIEAGSGDTKVNIIIAKPKGKSTTRAQAIRYPMDIWSEARARQDCEDKDGTFEPGVEESLTLVSTLEDLRLADEDIECLRSGEEVVVSVSEGKNSDLSSLIRDQNAVLDIVQNPGDDKGRGFNLDESDGLIWKELLFTGSWPGNGNIPPLEITLEMLQQIQEAFIAGVIPHVDVPVGGHAPDDVESNSGFVERVEIRSSFMPDEFALWVGIRFTDPEIEEKVREGSIVNISARIERNFTDPITGKTWPWVLWHAALTNKPVLRGLRPFLAASLAGLDIQAYRRDEIVDPETKSRRFAQGSGSEEESGAQEESQEEGRGSGAPEGDEGDSETVTSLSEEELEQIREEERRRIRSEVEAEYEPALADVRSRLQQAESLAMTHRSQLHRANVKQILLALQGRGEHERVKLPAGHALAPTVVSHVQPLLESDVGEETSVKLSVAGKEKQVSVTELVLGMINAVAEARDGAVISLAQHGSQSHEAPGSQPDDREEQDAQVDEFLNARGLMPVGNED